jgi:hypothetical protein
MSTDEILRFQGTLRHWDDVHGVGAIDAHDGGQELPVQRYDIAFRSQRPVTGEVWTFEVKLSPNGAKRAVNVRRLSDELADQNAQREQEHARALQEAYPLRLLWPTVMVVAVLGTAIGTYLWIESLQRPRQLPAPVAPAPTVPAAPAAPADLVAPATLEKPATPPSAPAARSAP